MGGKPSWTSFTFCRQLKSHLQHWEEAAVRTHSDHIFQAQKNRIVWGFFPQSFSSANPQNLSYNSICTAILQYYPHHLSFLSRASTVASSEHILWKHIINFLHITDYIPPPYSFNYVSFFCSNNNQLFFIFKAEHNWPKNTIGSYDLLF